MGLNWPLRGTKGSLFEGGTRVPALIRAPQLQGGTQYQGSVFVAVSTNVYSKYFTIIQERFLRHKYQGKTDRTS